MNDKLKRLCDLYYLADQGTSSQFGDKEKKEFELLQNELDTLLKTAEAFHNSKFGVYNNDYVNDLRKKEKELKQIKPKNEQCEIIGCGDNGSSFRELDGEMGLIKLWVCDKHKQ